MVKIEQLEKMDSYLSISLLQLFIMIHEFSENTYLVGGCVRDAILDRTPKDFDIVTDVPITKLAPELESNGWQIKGVGDCFLVYVVSKDGAMYEISNFRKDGPTSDGRRPETVSIGTIQDDSSRRDFTINSIYWNPIRNTMVDLNGGIRDIESRTLRFIGKPKDRIKEDYLRVFRLFRFASTLKFTIDKKSLTAAREMFTEAYNCTTPERVRQEIERMAL
jgi:tRNA nucleotidyltransferase/poly(A) polymerase